MVWGGAKDGAGESDEGGGDGVRSRSDRVGASGENIFICRATYKGLAVVLGAIFLHLPLGLHCGQQRYLRRLRRRQKPMASKTSSNRLSEAGVWTD